MKETRLCFACRRSDCPHPKMSSPNKSSPKSPIKLQAHTKTRVSIHMPNFLSYLSMSDSLVCVCVCVLSFQFGYEMSSAFTSMIGGKIADRKCKSIGGVGSAICLCDANRPDTGNGSCTLRWQKTAQNFTAQKVKKIPTARSEARAKTRHRTSLSCRPWRVDALSSSF